MPTYIDIPDASDIKDGEIMPAKVGNHDVLIIKQKGQYYTIDRRCTHMKGDLARGGLDGFVLTCPLHASQFDIRDGSVVRWTKWPNWMTFFIKLIKPEKPLKAFRTRIENGTVSIEVDE